MATFSMQQGLVFDTEEELIAERELDALVEPNLPPEEELGRVYRQQFKNESLAIQGRFGDRLRNLLLDYSEPI